MDAPVIDPATLNAAAAEALAVPDLRVVSWSATAVGYQVINLATAGLFRLSGLAEHQGGRVPWSIFLKILRDAPPEAGARFNSSPEPGHWNYWRREAAVYGADLLTDLPPGLAAPRCYAITAPVPTEAWLWLEEIVGRPGPSWPLPRVALAARHLGRLQGAFLTGARHVTAPWLSQHWLRAWVPDEAGAHLALVRDEAAWTHPLLEPTLMPALAEAVGRLWERRERLLSAVEQLPQTLCHLDVWPPNLFARERAGRDETVLLDWSQVGWGAPGEDIANLVLDSAWMQWIAGSQLAALVALALAGYLEGLRDAGWRGDAAAVRLAYAATAALRFGLLAGALLDQARRSELHAGMAARYGRPVPQILATRSAAVYGGPLCQDTKTSSFPFGCLLTPIERLDTIGCPR